MPFVSWYDCSAKSLDQLFFLYTQNAFIIYFGVAFLIVFSMYLLGKVFVLNMPHVHAPRRQIELGPSEATPSALAAASSADATVTGSEATPDLATPPESPPATLEVVAEPGSAADAPRAPEFRSPVTQPHLILQLLMESISARFSIPSQLRFLAISYAVFGGALSSINILMTKSIGELITVSWNGDEQFTKPLTYLFFGVMLFSNTSEV